MNEIVAKVLNSVLKNDKIFIPENLKRVKIDIGLAWNAPNSEYWLSQNDDVCVFGFEPSSKNHDSFITNNESTRKNNPAHKVINRERIFKTFFPIKCALYNCIPRIQNFYVTQNDTGCSSLYKPNFFPILEQEEVPVISLKDFFDVFPWEQIPYIEQIKIDAQGSDINIIDGAGEYLNNIVYLTYESSTDNQYSITDNNCSLNDILNRYNFDVIGSKGGDTICLNRKHADKVNSINFFIEGS